MPPASNLPPESSLEAAPQPPSFLQSALGLLRGVSRAPRRDAGPTIRVMFAPTRAGRSEGDAEALPAHDDPRAMRRALKIELNRVSGSRYVLRHLAKIEHDLKSHGLDLFDRLPLRVLEKASAQLESLVESPVTPGIAALRSRLAVALLARERIERPGRATARPAPTPAPRAAAPTGSVSATAQAPNGAEPSADGPAADDLPPAVRPSGSPLAGARHGASSAARLAAMSAWGGDDRLEVRESSFADFEQATTEWQLLEEPRQP